MYLDLSGFADTLLGLLLGWPLAPGSVSLTGTGPFSVTKVGDSHLLSHGLSRPCHWPGTDHRAGLSWAPGPAGRRRLMVFVISSSQTPALNLGCVSGSVHLTSHGPDPPADCHSQWVCESRTERSVPESKDLGCKDDWEGNRQ